MIIYPESDYDSFINEEDADSYFESRINAEQWDATSIFKKEAALMTAYRSLQALDIVLDLSDADQLKAIRQAQCEQALHELVNDLDGSKIAGLTLAGVLSVKLPQDRTEPCRHSPRALALLRPYLRGRSVTRTR